MFQKFTIANRARHASPYFFLTPLVAGLLSGPTLGQEGGALEEIIVTATFRETNVQDTPIAITAVSADMLEARSQTNLAQITAQTPNVSLRPAGSSFGSALVAFIRGIGQTDFNPSVEPGVGIYGRVVADATILGQNVRDIGMEPRQQLLTAAGLNANGGDYVNQPDIIGPGSA